MAHRGPPRTPKDPGPAARAPSTEAPPPPRSPRSRPLLLLLLLLAARGAEGRFPEPGRLGPRARLTRSQPSPLAGRALPGGGQDRQERDVEPGDPGPAPGPGEDGAPAAGQGRWVRAAPVTGAASPAQVSLTSSSFVLKGDATHNQAMVHWTGENSSGYLVIEDHKRVQEKPAFYSVCSAYQTSRDVFIGVILILTKYYHADTEKVLESSLWRSSDFGTTYTKLVLQPGFTTIIDSFYISPANKKKIIFMSSSLGGGEQTMFLSVDEATTFQKQFIPFTLETLIFHPRDEDKLLAYTKDSKLYVSCDLGKKWMLLHEQVTKDHVFWAESGVDADPDLVHLEAHDPAGGFRYLTGHIFNCSGKRLTSPFTHPIDQRSLVVQDDYVFFKATSANQTKYYVSYRRNDSVLMKLPKYALPKDLQIISTDENQVFVAVQEWYQTDTYHLYQSDPQGVSYSLVLEDVRSSRQAEEGVVVDVLEVQGVKGVFLANQKVNGKVVTLITYNKGRDWSHLRPPSVDVNGKPTDCRPVFTKIRFLSSMIQFRKEITFERFMSGLKIIQPGCHLHLHLLWADNPYVSGTVHTKDTAPGLIMGAGNLGSQLVEYKEEMYITSDCGNTWRQVFEEEHHILYLDHGGVIVAVKDSSIPLKVLRFSTDEGVTWSTYNFTDTSVFVDGLLSEPGEETLVITIFGHISYRSDWELVKVDFRPSFPRTCSEDDYSSWDLVDLQGDGCLMGRRRSFRKRKATSWCINGRNFTSALTSQVCPCRDSDFLCDYGFERSPSEDKCFANFWFNPLSPPDNCVLGQTYTNSLGYRKAVSNVCEGGVDLARSPAPLQCPLSPPRGLHIDLLGEAAVAVRPGQDILLEVRQEQGDVLTTKYQVDLGDGFKAMYMNLTLTGKVIRHCYENPGIYRVSVRAENVVGHDEAVLFVQVNSPLQALYLEVAPVIGINQEVNLTAVLLPLNPNLTVFYWWIGHSLQPLLSLNNSVTMRFADTGDVRVTVQAACGKSVLQDSKVIRVLDGLQAVPLQFSRNLDTYNPNTPEWREDVGLVVTWLLAKETGIPEELLVTVVKPGLPTLADLYVLLPPSRPTRKRSITGDKRLAAIQQVLSAQKISFLLRAGVRVLVALREVDTGSPRLGRSGSYWAVAVLLAAGLLSVVAFVLYKFKRKRPDRTVYAQMHDAKEQEMTSPVSQGVQSALQGPEFIDDDLGNHSGVVLSIDSREMHSYLVS